MLQLVQRLRSGEMTVQDVPAPVAQSGQVIVRNHYSLISAGTEGSTVRAARRSLIGKAKERPQQARQAFDMLRQQGIAQTYRAVTNRLEAYSPLGYSSSGEVIDVGAGVTGLRVGDAVACAGALFANHAEIIRVPINLCVRLPAGADLKRAAYNTLGAIAMQGVRQADLRLGETCAVIGLGLLGQLTCLLLRAAGVQAYGIDIDEDAVEVAGKHSCDHAWVRTAPGVTEEIARGTAGLGVDAVIITAASESLDPINFAGQIARQKGRVVVVGAVPTGFDREPFYYRKELELRMSCSYGPGRYDPQYEEKGIDYPAGYVRWTENRNMQAFQHLVHSEKIQLDFLTTHEFDIENAGKAYDLVLNRSEPFLGMMLKYDTTTPLRRQSTVINATPKVGKLGVAFIGAGSYAQNHLLPNLPDADEIVRTTVLTSTGANSKRVAERFRFSNCTSEPNEILSDKSVDAVFITTRHNSHADYVVASLQAGKHVFVEKPLCLNTDELHEIENIQQLHSDQHLLVGYNRRFSPLAIELKRHLCAVPMSVNYRVNAGMLPSGHWILDPDSGGGRVIGEVCHFIDLMCFLTNSVPRRVFASGTPSFDQSDRSVHVNVEFTDNSIGSLCYLVNGSKRLDKEYLEVHQSGVSAVLDDFKTLRIYGKGRPFRKKLFNQNKGQREMMTAFFRLLTKGGPPLISPEILYAVTRCTFAIEDSLRTGKAATL